MHRYRYPQRSLCQMRNSGQPVSDGLTAHVTEALLLLDATTFLGAEEGDKLGEIGAGAMREPRVKVFISWWVMEEHGAEKMVFLC